MKAAWVLWQVTMAVQYICIMRLPCIYESGKRELSMCGRFTLFKEPELIVERFGVDSIAIEEFKVSFNIPPTAKVPIITATLNGRRLETAKWGIQRAWAPQITNLQAEKILKGTFRKQLAAQRCIVPANGFYEWATRAKKKYPVYFQLKSQELFGFPGIYDEGELKTFSIFTIKPNAVVAPTHDRMPAILLRENESKWLDPKITDLKALSQLLITFPAEAMTSHEVTTAVSYARNDHPDLIKPI